MLLFGDPHGLAWERYDQNGIARTIRDQGGFHFGESPYEPTEVSTDTGSGSHQATGEMK